VKSECFPVANNLGQSAEITATSLRTREVGTRTFSWTPEIRHGSVCAPCYDKEVFDYSFVN
jgi:hypothetical protein